MDNDNCNAMNMNANTNNVTNPDLKKLTNEVLYRELKESVKEEKSATFRVLQYLHEAERRKLYLDYDCTSLHELCIKELRYSEGAADRRIGSMRLLRALPEIKEAVMEGSLNLTQLTQAQRFFGQCEKATGQSLSEDEKSEILFSIQGKSTRESERVLLSQHPDPKALPQQLERERQITPDHVELKLVLTEELRSKLFKLKMLLSHKNPSFSYVELIEELADQALQRLDPEERQARRVVREARNLARHEGRKKAREERQEKARNTMPEEQERESVDRQENAAGVPPALEVEESSKKAITASERRLPTIRQRDELWVRDKGSCGHIDLKSGRRCNSTFQLQPHHIIPWAKGGKTELSNLGLRCAPHNRYYAVQEFGVRKMARYFKAL